MPTKPPESPIAALDRAIEDRTESINGHLHSIDLLNIEIEELCSQRAAKLVAIEKRAQLENAPGDVLTFPSRAAQ